MGRKEANKVDRSKLEGWVVAECADQDAGALVSVPVQGGNVVDIGPRV